MTTQFELPTYCRCCGALLMGGATKHEPGCEIRKLIEEHFPGGIKAEPPSPLSRRIMEIRPQPDTRNGNWLVLECGHHVMAFGDLAHCEGWVLCFACANEEVKQ